MRKTAITLSSSLLLVAAVVASEGLMSGPQVGQKVPGPFEPMNVTGSSAGQKHCLFCENGSNPVAMIFAREASEPVVTLIKKIDAATAQHQDQKMGSFVVFLTDRDGLDKDLKELAEREQIKHTVLSIDKPEGPTKYKVAPNADVTVVLYTDRTVKANHAFAKGELTEAKIDQILSDLPKIFEKP